MTMEKTFESRSAWMTNITTLNNSKLGGYIPQVNMPKGLTCRPDAPCAKGCYCGKGNMLRTKKNHIKRLRMYEEAPEQFFAKIDFEVTLMMSTFFRWHSCGDIVDEVYFKGMVDIAEKHPNTRFLAFTKKYDIVNTYIYEGGKIPANFAVVFSTWGKGWDVPNPHELPMSYLRDGDNPDFLTMIPVDAYECCDNCARCISEGLKHCWDLKRGESVVFDKH